MQPPKRPAVSERLSVTCPDCQQPLDLRVSVTVAAQPPQHPQFADSDHFADWLRASRLSLSEFRKLPIYQAQPERFELLIETLLTDDTQAARAAPSLEDALRPHPAAPAAPPTT